MSSQGNLTAVLSNTRCAICKRVVPHDETFLIFERFGRRLNVCIPCESKWAYKEVAPRVSR